MKNLILIAAYTLFSFGALAQNASSEIPSEKQQSTKNADGFRPAKAKRKPITNFQEYAESVKEEITGNESRLAAFKAKLKSEKNQGDKKHEKTTKRQLKIITILENYNNELKVDLDNYIKYGIGDWKLFQQEFNQDLAELRSELTDLRYEYNVFIAQNSK